MFRTLPAILLVVSILARPCDAKQPNIAVSLADDLGCGDVVCYTSESKLSTPNLDRLAKHGMRFTDAHSPSTTR